MAKTISSIQVKRTASNAQLVGASPSHALAAGEIAFSSDTKEFWVGDGTRNYSMGAPISDTFANRPTAGAAGRFFYATDNTDTYFDNGTSWVQINTGTAISSLDDVADGSTYGRVLLTYLNSNRPDGLYNGTAKATLNDGGAASTTVLWTSDKIQTQINDAIDGLSWQDPVLDKDLSAAPGSPTTGDRYIVASANNWGIDVVSLTGGAGTNYIELAAGDGDQTASFAAGRKMRFKGTTGNDGEWTVTSSSFSTVTRVVITEALTDATADGNVHVAGDNAGGAGTWEVVSPEEIVEWDGSAWDVITAGAGSPSQGWATHVEDEGVDYVFNSSTQSWADKGTSVAHNSTSGLQGGTTGEYYHLTSSQHTFLADIADTTNVANGFLKRNSGNTDWEEVAYGSSSNTVAEGNDSRFPTSDEKAALAGIGTPSGANPYLTSDATFAGDVSGTYDAAVVDGIKGAAVDATPGAGQDGQILVFNNSTGQYEHSDIDGGTF